MSGYDVGIGVSQDLLNSITSTVYSAVYPNVFTGSSVIPTFFSLAVAWDVKSAPTFNLSAPDSNPANREGSARALTRAKAAGSVNNIFEMILPVVEITLSGAGMPTATGSVAVTAQFEITVYGANCFLVTPIQAVASGNETAPSLWLLNQVAMPLVLDALATYLSGLQLPPFELAGVTLGTPIVVVQDSHAIAVANVQGAQTPIPPAPGTVWPATDFFIAFNHWALQAATSAGLSNLNKKFQHNGGGSAGLAHYSWSYSMSLGNPQMHFSGANINTTLSLTGSVSASAGIGSLNLDFGLDASASPSAVGSLFIDANDDLFVTINQVNSFSVTVTPQTSLPDWLTGEIIAAIADAIGDSVVPLVTSFFKDISFKVWNVATFRLTEAGYAFSIHPSGVNITPFEDMLAAAGSLTVSPAATGATVAGQTISR